MGFDNEDHRAIAHLSKTLQYKVAGNSIVVNVLEDIIADLQSQGYLI